MRMIGTSHYYGFHLLVEIATEDIKLILEDFDEIGQLSLVSAQLILDLIFLAFLISL